MGPGPFIGRPSRSGVGVVAQQLVPLGDSFRLCLSSLNPFLPRAAPSLSGGPLPALLWASCFSCCGALSDACCQHSLPGEGRYSSVWRPWLQWRAAAPARKGTSPSPIPPLQPASQDGLPDHLLLCPDTHCAYKLAWGRGCFPWHRSAVCLSHALQDRGLHYTLVCTSCIRRGTRNQSLGSPAASELPT